MAENGLFRGAASHYARYRPRYPAELLARVAERAGLDGRGRLLDLGCGTGNVAIPLAAYVEEVVAVDIEPEMLAELRRAAPANVRTVEARAEDVDESWGVFRLATVGAALHWFDCGLVLGNLAKLTPAVALVGEDDAACGLGGALRQAARDAKRGRAVRGGARRVGVLGGRDALGRGRADVDA
jgi:SAM-dependent methyltransferase